MSEKPKLTLAPADLRPDDWVDESEIRAAFEEAMSNGDCLMIFYAKDTGDGVNAPAYVGVRRSAKVPTLTLTALVMARCLRWLAPR